MILTQMNSVAELIQRALIQQYFTVDTVLIFIAHIVCFVLGVVLYIAYITLQRNMLSDVNQLKKYNFRWRVAAASGIVNCAVTPMMSMLLINSHDFSALCFISVIMLVVTHTLGAWGLEKALRTWTNVWVSISKREKLDIKDIEDKSHINDKQNYGNYNSQSGRQGYSGYSSQYDRQKELRKLLGPMDDDYTEERRNYGNKDTSGNR